MTIMTIGDDELPYTNEDGELIDGDDGDPCCSPECPVIVCGPCEDAPDEIQIDVDASTAVANPTTDPPIRGCDDAACQDLSGSYILARGTCAGSWNIGSVNFDIGDTCCWFLTPQDNAETLPCVTNTFGDVMYFGWEVRVALGDDGNYWLWVRLEFCDLLATCAGTSYVWERNLGPDPPNCRELFESGLGEVEYHEKGDFMGTPIEQLTDPCYYNTIVLDVLAV